MNQTKTAGIDLDKLPRAHGVSRDAESPGGKGVLIFFERPLSDDEMRALHDLLARRAEPSVTADDARALAVAQEAAYPYPGECAHTSVKMCHTDQSLAFRAGWQARAALASPAVSQQDGAAEFELRNLRALYRTLVDGKHAATYRDIDAYRQHLLSAFDAAATTANAGRKVRAVMPDNALLVQAHRALDATTASASRSNALVTLESAQRAIEHVEQSNGHGRAAEARGMLERAPAPSRDAALQIKTWQERKAEYEGSMWQTTERAHMVAEIADLRAALARAPLPEQVEPAAWMVGRQLFISRDAIPFNLLPPLAHPVPLYLAAPSQAGDARDAAYFRWLNEDHADAETREKARELAGRLGTSSYSAITRDITAAMSASQDKTGGAA